MSSDPFASYRHEARFDAWNLARGAQSWNVGALAFNIVVLAFFAIVATMLWDRAVRDRFRVRLRTILGTMTVSAVLFGWWAREREDDEVEREIIKLLIADGHYLEVEYVGPLLARRALGVDNAPGHRAVAVYIDPRAALEDSENFVARLRKLKSLRRVNFNSFAKSVPETIPLLVRIESIRDVNFGGVYYLDVSSVRTTLLALPLESLSLAGMYYIDRYLEALVSSHSLRRLDLTATDITDKGLAVLSRGHGLRELDLSHTHVTEVGMESLARMPSLRKLNLAWTKVTDEGARALGHSRALFEVNLCYTSVSDAGLISLTRCSSLKRLIVNQGELTSENVAWIRAARPDLEVVEIDSTPKRTPTIFSQS